jgi:hypothetical protein
VTIDVRTARLDRPQRIRDFAIDQSFGLRIMSSDRDVSLTLRQIEKSVAGHLFETQVPIACMKRIDAKRAAAGILPVRANPRKYFRPSQPNIGPQCNFAMSCRDLAATQAALNGRSVLVAIGAEGGTPW